MKTLYLFMIMAILALGAEAQVKKSNYSKPVGSTSKPMVVKTASVASTSSLSFIATAYALKGKMANGSRVYAGAIAADPRILPLGTIVHIDGMGTFKVCDTGGDIKGRRVDIWMSSHRKAILYGRRSILLRVISKPTKSKK